MKIYFIQQGELGPIKIGISENLERRFGTARTFSPYSLRVLAIMKGSRKEEKQLHQKFRKEKLNGEWFCPSKKVIQYIQTLKGNNLDYCPKSGNEKLLNPLELADFLLLQVDRVLSLVRKNKIPHVKVNSMIYFKESEIEEWLKNLQMAQNPPQVGKVVNLTP